MFIRGIPDLKILTAKTNLMKRLNKVYNSEANNKKGEDNFVFFPRTWVLPKDGLKLRKYTTKNRNRILIVKSGVSSKGNGIFLVNRHSQIPIGQEFVVQEYVPSCFV
eukprot:UN33394